MLTSMDPTSLVVIVLAIVASWVVLYFVIKAAVKNALHEDRLFQAKVQKQREQSKSTTA